MASPSHDPSVMSGSSRNSLSDSLSEVTVTLFLAGTISEVRRPTGHTSDVLIDPKGMTGMGSPSVSSTSDPADDPDMSVSLMSSQLPPLCLTVAWMEARIAWRASYIVSPDRWSRFMSVPVRKSSGSLTSDSSELTILMGSDSPVAARRFPRWVARVPSWREASTGGTPGTGRRRW